MKTSIIVNPEKLSQDQALMLIPDLILELRKQIGPWKKSRDVLPATRGTYSAGIVKFLDYCDSQNIRVPSEVDLIAFKEDLKFSGYAVNTINLHLVGVRLFMKSVSIKSGYSQLNIGEDVKGLKGSEGHLRDAFTLEEILKIMDQIPRDTIQGKRDFAIVSAMVYLGLRTIEITRADIDDIRNKNGRNIIMIQGKGCDEKSQLLILRDEAKAAIDVYINERTNGKKLDPAGPLFVSHSRNNRGGRLTTALIRQMFSAYMKQAGIINSRLSCHSIRHFICTHLINQGVDIVKVQMFMRHKSIQTTLRYYHAVNRFDNPPEDSIDLGR